MACWREGKPVGIGGDHQLIVYMIGCQGRRRADLLLHCDDWELREGGVADFLWQWWAFDNWCHCDGELLVPLERMGVQFAVRRQ